MQLVTFNVGGSGASVVVITRTRPTHTGVDEDYPVARHCSVRNDESTTALAHMQPGVSLGQRRVALTERGELEESKSQKLPVPSCSSRQQVCAQIQK